MSGAQEGVGVRVLVTRPNEDAGTAVELSAMQGFMDQGGFSSPARSNYRDHTVRGDGRGEPVLQFREFRVTPTKILSGLKSVTEERLPDACCGLRRLRFKIGERGCDLNLKIFGIRKDLAGALPRQVLLELLEPLNGLEDFRSLLRLVDQPILLLRGRPWTLGVNEKSKHGLAGSLGGI